MSKSVLSMVNQIDMEPSLEFYYSMESEFGFCDSKVFKKAWYESNIVLFTCKMAGIIAICILITIILVDSKPRVKAKDYSFERFAINASTDTSEEFERNMNQSEIMANRFMAKLPYKGKFQSLTSSGSYTVDCHLAEEFPDYYAGRYLNINGHLIIQIKEEYYVEDYIKTEWYSELREMLGSDEFACHPVKYSYSELINGMSNITSGKLAEDINQNTISVIGIGIDDYFNAIIVEVESEEDYKKLSNEINSNIYNVVVVGDVTIMDN